MSNEKKLKLNLRSSSQKSAESGYEADSLLYVTSEDRGDARHADAAEAPSASHPGGQVKQGTTGSSKLPAAGDMLRTRGKRTHPELKDLWDIQQERREESIFATQEVSEVVEKAGVAIGKLSQRFKTAYKDAKSQSASVSKRVQGSKPPLQKPVGFELKSTPSVFNKSKASSASAKTSREPIAPKVIEWLQALPITRKQIAVVAVVGIVFMTGRGVFGGSDDGSQAVNGASTTLNSDTTGSADKSTTTAPEQGNTEDTIAVIGRETDFELVFPTGQTKADTGIALISPPNVDPVYAFNDELQGSLLSISQQEVPTTFRSNPEQSLEDLATSFAATESFRAGDGTVVYHGYTDKNGGVQSLLMVKANLLVLISSTERLSDAAWSEYIAQLD